MNPTSELEYLEWVPRERLRRRVRCLWALRAPADPSAGFEPVFPDGCPEVVLHLADRFQRSHGATTQLQDPALLIGQLLEPVRLRPTGRTDIVGIRFEPWGLRRLLDLSAAELTGATLPAGALARALSSAVPERLARLPDLEARCRTLEALLLDLGFGADPPPVPWAVRALAMGAIRSVSGAARTAGVTPRQVERQCARWSGLTPHDLIRLARFQRALGFLRHRPDRNLTWIAHASGFADQAHFSRDFGAFAGRTPSAFRAGMSDLTAVFLTEEGAPARPPAE